MSKRIAGNSILTDISSSFTYSISIIVKVMLLLTVAGCGESENESLLCDADNVIEQHPDSALILLESIDRSSLHSDKLRAKFNLLYTEAKVKTDIPIDSASPIDFSVSYYKSHQPESFDCMRSLYYRSQIKNNALTDNADDSDVMACLIQANQIAKGLANSLWIARTSEQIGMWYANQAFNDSLFLEYACKAATHYEVADKRLNSLYARADMMAAYNRRSEFDRSIALGDSLLSLLSDHPDDQLLRQYILQIQLSALVGERRLTDAADVIAELEQFESTSGIESSQYLNSAQVKLAFGDPEGAEKYIALARNYIRKPQEMVQYYDILSLYYRLKDDYGMALAMSDSISAIQTKEITDILQHSTSYKESEYYHQQSIIKEIKARALRSVICVLIITFLLISSVAVYAYRQKTRRRNEFTAYQKSRIDEAMKEIEILGNTASQLRESVDERDKRLIMLEENVFSLSEKLCKDEEYGFMNLFDRQCKIINKICAEYLSDDNSTSAIKVRHKNVETILDDLRSPKLLADIEKILNHTHSDVIRRLRDQCDMLSEDDISLILLYNAHFKPQTIALILNMKLPAIYKRKARLQEKITGSDLTDKSEFLTLLK